MYPLDTNVVSELRKPRLHGAVLAWLNAAAEADLHVSTVTLGEIQARIELTREQDPPKAAEIESWRDRLSDSLQVLPMEGAAFRAWARLMLRKSDTLYEDAMSAATAQLHRLTVVKRNVTDFGVLGVPVLDPFDSVRG